MSNQAAVVSVNIPEELKELKQWVLYKKEERNGSFTKPPYQVNGEYAKTNAQSTWSSYEEVVTEYQSNSKYDGIGFVFTEEDEYVGIDLDDVLDPDSGTITKEAKNIIEYIASYTEVSPSGKGIHIIARKGEGVITGGRMNTSEIKSLEIYSEGRYFTVTGDVFQEMREIAVLPETISNVQDLMTKGEDVYVSNSVNENEHEGFVEDQGADSKVKVDIILKDLEKNHKFKALFFGHYENLEYTSPSEADMALCRVIANRTRDSRIIDEIFRRSELFRPKWDEKHSSDGGTYGENTIKKVISSIDNTIMPKATPKDKINMSSEWSVKNNIVKILKEVLNYNVENGWYLFNPIENKWENKNDSEVANYIGKTIYSMISTEFGEDNELYNKYLSAKGIKSIMDLYKGDDKVIVKTETMNPSYIRLKDAFVNLENGKVEQGYTTYDTRQVDTRYNPNAKAPKWEKFVLECANGNQEIAGFIKRVAGYAFTGHTREQVAFFLIGPGANGKSLFANVLTEIAGNEFAKQMPSGSLIAGRYSGKEYDMAHINGARLVFANELNEGYQLDEAKMKMLTGEDKITGRHLYKEYFQYRPEFKIFFVSNVMPTIRSTNEGMWRRAIIIPFEKIIPAEKQDKQLIGKLLAEREGIVKWIIEGSIEWHRKNLNPPECIKETVKKYRMKDDVVYHYINERLEKNSQSFVFTKELLEDFLKWSDENEVKTKISNQAMLTRAFSEKGYERIEKRNCNNQVLRAIKGLKIKK